MKIWGVPRNDFSDAAMAKYTPAIERKRQEIKDHFYKHIKYGQYIESPNPEINKMLPALDYRYVEMLGTHPAEGY